MRRFPRWPVVATVVAVLALGGLAGMSIQTARGPLPQVSGQITVRGLNGSVEVVRDSLGVPQIYADQAEDLFQAQGYVAAQDRFYEMDIRRHAAAGRLSELFGASQVEFDSYVRTLGWRRTAEAEVPLLSPSTHRYLDAYAAGVNAYLHGKKTGEISLEYTLLGWQGLDYTPQPWTVADSISMLKVLAWQLGSNADQESARARTVLAVGPERTADLYPDYPLAGYDPILPRGALVGDVFDPAATPSRGRPIAAARPAVTGGPGSLDRALARAGRAGRTVPALFGTGDGAGSNSWAVSGAHTVSGAAMLSNDPHLATSIPSIFAQVGLHCRRVGPGCPFDVSGFSVSALPGVVIGRNASIAWAMTTSYADVQDLFTEDVVGDTVRVGDGYEPLTIRTEQILVRGEEQPRTLRIRSSRHGPLLSDASPETAAAGRTAAVPPSTGSPGSPERSYAVAVQWVGAVPGRSMDALLGLDAAHDWKSFRAAVSLLSAPSQNLVYADVKGNIGYQLPGAIPIRGRGDGRTPAPGWDRRFDWTGTIAFNQLPYVYNPPGGRIVAANQPVIGRQYRYLIGSAFSYGWRSQELSDRLKDAPKLTMDTAEDLFYDHRVRAASGLVPALLKVRVDDGWVAEGQRTLVGWDYSDAADSAAAAYFNVVFRDVEKLTFRDQLPSELWPTGGDRWFAVVDRLLTQPDNPWWDDVNTPQVETRDDILLAAMTLARKEATSRMARDTDQWRWGRLHQVRLKEQTLGSSGIAPLEWIFNREQAPVSGGTAVVNAMGFDDRSGFDVSTGPAMRMLVDFSAPDDGRWVNQSGASGHAFSPHYDDQAPLWIGQQTWPFVRSRAAVDARTVERLVLEPGG